MIPGKHYKPEDFVEAAWRRRWLIVVPLVLVSVVTFTVVQMLPDRYQSSALLLIVPQRVPENYVRSTITTSLSERLQAIGQEILSRTRLENIIQEFDLYPQERQRMIMEDVILMMRADIIFSPRASRGDSGSFTLSFQYADPRTAVQVTERLASLFIRENIENRAMLAEQTDQFLQSQLQEAERALREREQKLATFRRTHPGLMPSQMDSNQQALQNAQMQLQAIQEAMSHDRDQQLIVQRQLADLAAAPVAIVPETAPSAPQTFAQQLENARTARKMLEMRLKPGHPDLKSLDRSIKELESKAAAEALDQPMSAAPVQSTGEAARSARLADLQQQAIMLERRMAQRQHQETQLLASMTTFRQRLEAGPSVESDLTELMRDYTTLQTAYQSLLSKSQEAKVAANLERRQIGEQFKVIDSPAMPQRPTSPNRLRLNLLGTLAGLLIGLAAAALVEYRDTTLRTEDDVVVALSLPVLAMVPTMTTKTERRRSRRLKLLLASSGVLAVAVCIAALAWKLRLLNDWIW